MRQEQFAKLTGSIAADHPNITGVVVRQHGETLYENYFCDYVAADAVHVYSVTKSVVSLLIGIAMDQGLIRDVRQPVLDFFPDYTIKRGEKTIQSVTLEHLLTMTAPYKYSSEPWTKVCTSDDWTVAALDLLGGRAGITGAFHYATLGVHILTGVITKTSGMETADFANKYLFEPIGVAPHRRFDALTAEEHREFILSKQPKENVWFSDPHGVCTAGYGLCLSARDMAKIGQLCLDDGVCNGKRIVSAAWIAESTKPRLVCGERFANMAYGYLWWTPEPDRRAYAALGNSGNVIYIDPARSAVVAINGTFKPNIFDRVSFIRTNIEPLLSDDVVDASRRALSQ